MIDSISLLTNIMQHYSANTTVKLTFFLSSPFLQEDLWTIKDARKTMPRHQTPPQKPRTPVIFVKKVGGVVLTDRQL